MAHRDSRGRDVAYEHTEFTSGKEIRQAASNAGIGLKYDYDTTFFRFADYRTGEENAMQGASSGRTVSITHSDHYKTSFRYDPQSRTCLLYTSILFKIVIKDSFSIFYT